MLTEIVNQDVVIKPLKQFTILSGQPHKISHTLCALEWNSYGSDSRVLNAHKVYFLKYGEAIGTRCGYGDIYPSEMLNGDCYWPSTKDLVVVGHHIEKSFIGIHRTDRHVFCKYLITNIIRNNQQLILTTQSLEILKDIFAVAALNIDNFSYFRLEENKAVYINHYDMKIALENNIEIR
jgi:hypothetical protein